MVPGDIASLLERYRASVDAAEIACPRSATLVDDASQIAADAFGIRARVLQRRTRADPSQVVSFRVRGMVDRHRAAAWWAGGDGLVCSEPLRERAAIVVELGDTFTDEGGRVIAASLTEPVPAMLTVIRALSRVTAVEVVGGRSGAA